MFKSIQIKENDQLKDILVNLDEISMIYPTESGSILYLNGQYVVSTILYSEWSMILKNNII